MITAFKRKLVVLLVPRAKCPIDVTPEAPNQLVDGDAASFEDGPWTPVMDVSHLTAEPLVGPIS